MKFKTLKSVINDKQNRDFEEFDDRKAKCFFVPFEEIKENDYGLSISNYKEVEYEEPEVIKKKILELENKIINGLDELNL